MNGAGSTKSDAAAEFRTAHAENIPQNPEQRRIAIDVDAVSGSINSYSKGHLSQPFGQHSANSICKRAAIGGTLETNDQEGN